MQALLDSGFVVEDALQIIPALPTLTVIRGKIHCIDGLFVEVNKLVVAVSGEGPTSDVKTSFFSYSGVVRGHGNVFRYDSAHEDHNCFPHKHEFDFFNEFGGDRLIEIEDENDIPTLYEAVSELQDWHQRNLDRLPTRGAN